MTLRVVVASDSIGELDPPRAGTAIARGWADSAQVAMVPLADGGPALGAALSVLLGGELVTDGPRWRVCTADTLVVGLTTGTSAHLGSWTADCLAATDAHRVVLDLTGLCSVGSDSAGVGRADSGQAGVGPAGVRPADVDRTGVGRADAGRADAGRADAGRADAGRADAGVGLLAALGARLTCENGRLAAADLSPIQLGDRELLAVVPAAEADWTLLGLRGAVVRRGYDQGRAPADILAEESDLTTWLGMLGVVDAPGAGAAGGIASAVLALGGGVIRGARLCAELAGLDRTIEVADLVVVGCTSFDIGSRGGTVVGFVAEAAMAMQRPCLVFAAESSVGRREMRTFGVEAAYQADPGPLSNGLTAAVRRVAAGWTGTGKGHLH